MAKTIGQLTQATTLASGDEFIIEQSGLTKRVAASVVRGGLVNADIDAAAAIAGSKLADDAITTAKIDDDAVTTAKILDANVTPAKLSQPLTLETAQATTSGTSIDFTGIPSWVRRVTIMFSGVSLSGTANCLVQIGSGSVASSGYLSSTSFVSTAVGSANSTGGFILVGGSAAQIMHGTLSIVSMGANIYASSHTMGVSNMAQAILGGGSVTLSGALDRIRLTTTNGTDTFDAGSVNIMYEG
jgi:hypothetical protein